MISPLATYGHGTENDFVLVFDPDGVQEFSAETIARICDRKTGIGADGLIRILKRDGTWFMDYRNRDGSIAEMCGNGIRVMARYLVDRGHQRPGIFPINTRSGKKFLSVPETGEEHNTGIRVNVGNPHAVFFVNSLEKVGDLKVAPKLTPVFPEGMNVEFVEERSDGELNMRVHERGVGETRSCGTGTCAVAMAATFRHGGKLPSRWVIHPPGGRLEVEIDAHSNAILTGPALLVRDVDLSKFLEKQI
jgi:diaminopimelate epimerase